MIASGKRKIKNGQEFNKYFKLSDVKGNEITLIADGNVDQTIGAMKKIVNDTLAQTKLIAPVLKGRTRIETAKNIWYFVYNHIQYKKDNPLREQIRTPLRTWNDRSSGVDCDCYSVFISSILTNLGIPHALRIAGYKADFQHVYIIIPQHQSDYSKYITIDCVADTFNSEVPFTKKKDYIVMGANSLNGLGNTNCRKDQPMVYYMNEEMLNRRGYLFTSTVLKELGIPFREYIKEGNNRPEIEFTVNGKTNVLPTAITRENALVLKQNILNLNANTSLSGFDSKKALWIVGGLAALLMIFKKPASVAGLAGVDKARSMSLINI